MHCRSPSRPPDVRAFLNNLSVWFLRIASGSDIRVSPDLASCGTPQWPPVALSYRVFALAVAFVLTILFAP
eukprot:5710828-Pyramimonas_sp.AAC.1